MDSKEGLNPRMNTLTTINIDVIPSILTIRMPHNTMKDNPIVPRNCMISRLGTFCSRDDFVSVFLLLFAVSTFDLSSVCCCTLEALKIEI